MPLDASPVAVARRVRIARALSLWSCRLVGFVLLVRGVYLLINRLAFGITQGDVAYAYDAYTGVGKEHMVAAGIAATLVGLALVLLARPLSRCAIAMPDAGCPSCGHTGEIDGDGRCVECGWQLDASSSRRPDA
ncbi:MAG: hypothetical protein RIE77_02630 [Phycisphaerales bacterium]|jgi:hypothetical protein